MVIKKKSIDFNRNFPYGKGETERVIEIDWALSQYSGEEKVLEVGCSFAEQQYIDKLKSLNIPLLFGIDVSDRNAPDFIKKTADIRKSGFPEGFFDFILCISTIEHVGKDNKKHYSPIKEIEQDQFAEDNIIAMKEMWRILKKKGKLIITVPFGKLHDYEWFTHYDSMMLDKLISSVNYKKIVKEFFIYDNIGWNQCEEQELRDVLYNDNSAPAAAGLCCLMLRK
jgi:SAM-dependent methyltransferase